MNKIYVMFFLYLLSPLAFAQTSNETNLFIFSYPESGNWFTNDGSKTGFTFDVQNGILAGNYLGYEGNGDPIWLTFSGALQPLTILTDPEQVLNSVGWQLEADLLRFENGGCILNCDSNTATNAIADIVGTITLHFFNRDQGRFFIDDNKAVNITPLYFGTSALILDTEPNTSNLNGLNGEPIDISITSTVLPDLEGSWVTAVDTSETINQTVSSTVIEIGPREVITDFDLINAPSGTFDSTILITRQKILSDTNGTFNENAAIICFQTTSTVFCIVSADGSISSIFTTPSGFNNRVRGITDSRFIIFDLSSSTLTRLEAFRLNYD